MQSSTIRRWSGIHSWTSLICTLFLLMLALTGLPLIFHHELEQLLGEAPELREMPADAPHLGLQQLVEAAQRHRPGEVVQYLGFEKDEPNGVVAITAATAGTEPNASHTFMLDARSGEPVAMPAANGGVLMFILRLHVDLPRQGKTEPGHRDAGKGQEAEPDALELCGAAGRLGDELHDFALDELLVEPQWCGQQHREQ